MNQKPAHALLSASGASRWMNCTPSARLTEKIPSTTSVYAKEGTLAHELAEVRLAKHFNLELASGETYLDAKSRIFTNELYSDEMSTEVDKYVDEIVMVANKLKHKYGYVEVYLENRLDFSGYVPEGFGTGDVIVCAGDELYIIDLKYGKGVPVYAENNPQIRLYALGAIDMLSLMHVFKTITMVICQPRLNTTTEAVMDLDELNTWAAQKVVPAAQKAWDGKGEQNPGSWCKWCKLKPTCRALHDLASEQAMTDFADPYTLTDEEVIQAYKKADLVSAWIDALKEYVLTEAKQGKVWSGYKLVEGKSKRVYTSEEKIKTKLLDSGYELEQILQPEKPRKIKGITDMSKLLKKANMPLIAEFIDKPPGKPTLVENSDSRPAIADSVFDDFAEPLEPTASEVKMDATHIVDMNELNKLNLSVSADLNVEKAVDGYLTGAEINAGVIKKMAEDEERRKAIAIELEQEDNFDPNF